MTLENINKPNPKHYKFELRNVPVIIDGEEKVIDSLQLETRYILKDLLNDTNLTHEQAFWYGNIGKRYFRLCKKHDDPTTDIKKIIQEATFLLSSVLGEEYKAQLLDADGNDLLNEKEEEIAVFDKLNDLLNVQEKEFLKDKKFECVFLNGTKIAEEAFEKLVEKINKQKGVSHGE